MKHMWQTTLAIVVNNIFSCSVLSSYFRRQFFQTSIRFVFKLALATRFPFDGKSRFTRIFTGNFLEKIPIEIRSAKFKSWYHAQQELNFPL